MSYISSHFYFSCCKMLLEFVYSSINLSFICLSVIFKTKVCTRDRKTLFDRLTHVISCCLNWSIKYCLKFIIFIRFVVWANWFEWIEGWFLVSVSIQWEWVSEIISILEMNCVILLCLFNGKLRKKVFFYAEKQEERKCMHGEFFLWRIYTQLQIIFTMIIGLDKGD